MVCDQVAAVISQLKGFFRLYLCHVGLFGVNWHDDLR